MSEIIQLLPDHLANQIAAGEVVQRPASVVKELLENSLDAGGTEIKLIIRDAGKELIQVVDNGKGMSPIDARMSFERHATSKIRNIEDLFNIRTMGFRGEALASIAAVAQVELKTRTEDEELGTLLQIEASEVKKQEATGCPKGTNLAIRNLFYNVPARRKFLKSNTTELKHIVDEFIHVTIAFPNISFSLYQNDVEQFNLRPGSLKSRIIELLGSRIEKQLIPISEDFEWIKVEGFIGKPEAATRARGNQFFFVNERFIRSPYLNHAVVTGFENLIEKESYPLYVLRLAMDPGKVDINVHPTKQEVKFDDERMIYALIQAAVKQALAKNNVAPSLDFTLNPAVQNLDAIRLPVSENDKNTAKSGYLANTFSRSGQSYFIENKEDRKAWEQQRQAFFPDTPESVPPHSPARPPHTPAGDTMFQKEKSGAVTTVQSVIQWGEFLVTTVKSGILLVHKRRALERIAFENLEQKMKMGKSASQQLLFPFEAEFSPAAMVLIREAIPILKSLGFGFTEITNQKLTVIGLPPELNESEGQNVLATLSAQLENNPDGIREDFKKKLLEVVARRIAQSHQGAWNEGQELIDELFACGQPNYSPAGKKVFSIISPEQLNGFLG